MTQNDFSLANQTFPSMRTDMNGALQALATLSSGSAEPATMYAYQLWADTTTGLLKIRNAANSAWITVGTLASTNLGLLALSGGSLTGALNLNKGSDIASATTTDIGAATGTVVDVTGTTTITGFGTAQAGTVRLVRFMGALTLTHNATSLILPAAANITTAAGDIALCVSLGSGNWFVAYSPKSGLPVAGSPGRLLGTQYFTTPGTSTYTPTSGTNYVIVEGWGGGGSGSSAVNAAPSGGCPGGAGGYFRKKITSSFSGVTVTVGSGGAAVSQSNGNNGGSTSFGSICSATGGQGPTYITTSPSYSVAGGSYTKASTGGTATGGDLNITGGGGFVIGANGTASTSSVAGAPAFGTGVGFFSATNSAGTNGSVPGGGGSGSAGVGYSSGAGGNGMIIVWEYS